MQLKIEVNTPKIMAKVENDKFGKYVSETWKKLIDPYTPRDTGTLMGLMGDVDVMPFALHYKAEYASAVYYNKRGVTFIREGTDRNPSATQEWDIAAEKAGQKNKLYRTLNNALQSGKY